MPERIADLLRLLVAIVLPPIGVATQVGFTAHFWLNIVLCLCGWLPGVIHAAVVIMTFDSEDF